jgi:hypothetical protein
VCIALGVCALAFLVVQYKNWNTKG